MNLLFKILLQKPKKEIVISITLYTLFISIIILILIQIAMRMSNTNMSTYINLFHSFNKETIKNYFIEQIKNNTYSIFIFSHYLDFLFSFTYIVWGFGLSLLFSRSINNFPKLQIIALLLSFSAVIAGISDMSETALLIYMTHDLRKINNTIINAQGIFVIIKEIFIDLTLLWLLFCGIISLFRKTLKI